MQKPLPILYSFRRCPYAMRARFALKYAGVTCLLREISLKDKPSAMLIISPKGTVPVLQLENKVIDESMEIIRWALNQNDPEGFLKLDDKSEHLAKQIIENNDNHFVITLSHYKYRDRYPEIIFTDTNKKMHDHLNELETLLKEHDFLLAKHPTMADIALFPFIRQLFRINEQEFLSWHYINLKKWLHFFLEHQAFAACMKKYPLWQGGPGELF